MIGGLGVLLIAVAAAAPPTVDDVLASVERHHPKLLAAEAKAQAAAGGQLGALGWLDPVLLGSAGWRDGPYDNAAVSASVRQATPLYGLTVEAGYRLGTGKFPAYDGAYETLPGGAVFAGLNLPLLKGGWTDPARTGAVLAQLDVEAAEADLVLQRILLGRDARAAYWKWVAAAAKLGVAVDGRTLATTSASAIQRSVALGDAAAIDAVDIERVVLEREATVVEAKAQLEAAAWKLGLYLRDEAGRPAPPSGPDHPELVRPPAPELPTLDEAVAEALRARPEARLLTAKRDAAEAKLRLARFSALPKLDLKLGVEQDFDGEGVGTSSEPVDLKVGGALEFPLLLRSGRGKLLEASAERTAAEALLSWQIENIDAQVRVAHAVALAAHQRAKLADDTAKLAQEVEVATRRRWELGDADLFRLYQREQSTLKAASDAAQAWGDYHAAAAELAAAMGRR